MNSTRRLLTFAVLAALLTALPALADGTFTTLLNAVTTPGASAAIRTTPGSDTGGEHVTFVYRATGSGAAKVQLSMDAGSTWIDLHALSGRSEVWTWPVCGGCRLRAYAVTASATSTVTVSAGVSGAATLENP